MRAWWGRLGAGRRDALIGLAFLFALLLLWQLAAAAGLIRPFYFPPPGRLLAALIELTQDGFPQGLLIWHHIGISLWRVLQGYGAALALAIPLGLLIGSAAVLDKLTLPVITFARSAGALSLLPLVIIWFGTGEASKVFLIGYGCFWTMLPSVVTAVKYVDPLYLRAARMLDTSGPGIFFRVVLPAALPRLFAGARVALGVGFMIIVGAEMIGTIEGLGALIMEARTFFRSDITIVGMILIGLLGFAISLALASLERFLLPWHRGLEDVRR